MSSRFEGIPPERVDPLLSAALDRGGWFAELFLERRVSRHVRMEDGVVRIARSGTDAGAGVRVLEGDRTGYASTDDIAPEALMEAARAASSIASSGGTSRGPTSSHGMHPAPPAPAPASPPDLEARVALVARLDAAARAADPRVTQVIASLSDEQSWIQIANSDGLVAARRQDLVGASVIVVLRHGNARQRGYFAAGGREGLSRFEKVTPETIAAEAVRRAVVQLDAVEAPAGPQPVVIGNGWGGVLLHEAIGHGFEADFVRRKTSVFGGRVGEPVASSLCTIIDDGSLQGLRGSFEIDDEGVPGQPTVLVERGVLAGYLHDRLSARVLGASPTGNGRRQDYRCVPIPRQTNLYMAAGPDSAEEIIRSVSRGFYARHIGGGQVDITSGSFVFQVTEGYLIEEGRLTAPVKNANLAGVGHEVLGRVTRVAGNLEFDPGIGVCGKEGQRVPVGVGQPTVLVSSMTVGGTRL